MEWWQTIALGCAGGALPDLLRIIEHRHDPAPEYLKRGFFWVSLALLVGLGGTAAYLIAPLGVIDALAVGFSAPSLVSSLLGQKEPDNRRKLEDDLRNSYYSDVANEAVDRFVEMDSDKPETNVAEYVRITRIEPSFLDSIRSWWGGGNAR